MGEILLLVANNNYEILDNNQQDEYNIVLKASNGDKIALEYIITKYKNFVKAKAKSYFLVGADKDDIIQEGMNGLYKAVRDFDGSKTNSFKCFAEICITRQIITAIKTANRQKNIPLNSAFSINAQIFDEGDESDKEIVDILDENNVKGTHRYYGRRADRSRPCQAWRRLFSSYRTIRVSFFTQP